MPVPGAIGAVTDEPTGANVIIVEWGWAMAFTHLRRLHDRNAVTSFVTDSSVVP